VNARLEAVRQREVAQVLDLCATQQESLAEAKQRAAEDPSPENVAAKKDAMAEMRAFRAWLREGSRSTLPQGEAPVPQPQRPKGRIRRGGA
jgi:hypothetical protein